MRLRKNNVANILFIIGIIVFVLGGIGGLFSGDGIIMVWFSSFVSGMFFIALSEIIELIDTKLEFANNRLSNLENLLESTSFVDKTVIEADVEAQFIKDYYYNKNIQVRNIYKSSIKDHCLVELENGEEEMIELGGFKPIVKSKESWEPELIEWYNNREF